MNLNTQTAGGIAPGIRPTTRAHMREAIHPYNFFTITIKPLFLALAGSAARLNEKLSGGQGTGHFLFGGRISMCQYYGACKYVRPTGLRTLRASIQY